MGGSTESPDPRHPPGCDELKRSKMKLEGKSALVTGAGSGIGRAFALGIAREGANVAVNDLNEANGEAVAAEIRALGRKATLHLADVSNTADVTSMVANIEREFGQIDILVNNAGIGHFVPFPEITRDNWDKMLAVHLTGTFNCCQAVLGGMLRRRTGKILNVSSIAAKRGDYMGHAHYTAAKSGIMGLTRSLAGFAAPHGINVNAIAPGFVETPLTRNMTDAVKATTLSRIPLGRIARAEEIAAAGIFLVTDDASYIVGETLNVSGGTYMD
jgi:NAD(P)-dependent dehydrogenase (short-subunit alcohol dehydrogenase family)